MFFKPSFSVHAPIVGGVTTDEDHSWFALKYNIDLLRMPGTSPKKYLRKKRTAR
jgi:hypothetical protein